MAGTSLGTALGATAFESEFSTSARGATTVIDDFEDDDLSEYNFERGGSNASVVSSPAQSGSYALEYTGTNIEGISKSGLDAYPSAGDTFSFWVRASGGADNLNVTWGVQDHQNRYYAKLKVNSGEFGLFTYKSGSGDSKDYTSSLSLSQDTWYEIEIDWATDGNQTATLYDKGGTQLAQLSMKDTDWSSGGIGYDAYLGSGESVYFDYVTLGSSSTDTVSSPDYEIVDDFEKPGELGSLYSFNTGSSYASIVTDSSANYSGSNNLAPTYNGERVLEHSGGDVEMFSLPGGGLQNHPSAGDTFSSWVLSEGGAGDTYLAYGVQDSLEDFYFVNVDFTNQKVHLFKRKNGDSSWLEGTYELSIDPDTWYYLTVHWRTDGTHEIYLYDSAENVIGEFSAQDSDFSDGGIGFITYPGDSSERFYWDLLINGEHGKGTTGGWGTEHRYAYSQTDTGTEDTDLVEDFNWYLRYGGWNTIDENGTTVYLHRFALTNWCHTYKMDTTWTSSPSSSDMSAAFLQDENEFVIDVTSTEGGTDNYVNVEDTFTYGIGLDGTNWTNWKDNYFGESKTRKEIRKEAKQSDEFENADSPWFFDALKFLLGQVTGIGNVITLVNFIDLFWRENQKDCDYTEDDTPTHHYSTWYFCDGKGLSGHTTEFTIRIPENEKVDVSITQEVRNDSTSFNPPNTLTWNLTIPAKPSSENIDLILNGTTKD